MEQKLLVRVVYSDDREVPDREGRKTVPTAARGVAKDRDMGRAVDDSMCSRSNHRTSLANSAEGVLGDPDRWWRWCCC